MFGIGPFEFFLILIFGFLIFGPDKLPAIAKTVGQAISKFKNAQEEMSKLVKTDIYDPASDEPFKNPLDALSKIGGSSQENGSKEAVASKDPDQKPVSTPEATNKPEPSESFSERKAKYDKERAAKRAGAQGAGSASATGSRNGTAQPKTAKAKVTDASAKEDGPARATSDLAEGKAKPGDGAEAPAQAPARKKVEVVKADAEEPAEKSNVQKEGE